MARPGEEDEALENLPRSHPPKPPQTPLEQIPQTAHSLEHRQPPPSQRKKWLHLLATFLADQWFLIGMGIAIAVASQIQVPESQQQLKETIVTYLNVSLIFFITGCTLESSILIQNYARWRVHVYVQASCFLMTSALAFGVVSAAATNRGFMDPGLLVGMIFFSCVATTMSSNVVMTAQAGGNRALTVVQTTVGNFLGVFVSPALAVMFTSVDTWYNRILPPGSGAFGEIYGRVLKQLGLSIYVPLAAGQVTRYFFPRACGKVFGEWKLAKLNSVCMLVIIWQTYDTAFASRAFDTVPASNMVFVVFVCLGLFVVYLGLAFASALLWLPRKDVVAVCYCVPAKGVALAVPLSTTIFAGMNLVLRSKIQVPIVIYQGMQVACGSALIPALRKWIAAGEKSLGVNETPDIEAGHATESPSGGDRDSVEPKPD